MQEISDTVRDPEFKDYADLVRQIQAAGLEVQQIAQRLIDARSRGRFLMQLGNKMDEQADGGEGEDPKDDCVICYGSSDDKEGLLLGCAHFFCKVSLIYA